MIFSFLFGLFGSCWGLLFLFLLLELFFFVFVAEDCAD